MSSASLEKSTKGLGDRNTCYLCGSTDDLCAFSGKIYCERDFNKIQQKGDTK